MCQETARIDLPGAILDRATVRHPRSKARLQSSATENRINPLSLQAHPVISDRTVGALVSSRPAVEGDVPALAAIQATPEVRSRWRGDDLEQDMLDSIGDDELDFRVIEDRAAGRSGGRCDSMVRGGRTRVSARQRRYVPAPKRAQPWFGSDAVRTLCRHLFDVESHHRITIDPATDNHTAIPVRGVPSRLRGSVSGAPSGRSPTGRPPDR